MSNAISSPTIPSDSQARVDSDGNSSPEASLQSLPIPTEDPVVVQVGIYVYDIFRVDETRQTFEADFYLTLRWQDSRLARRDGCVYEKELSEIWHPHAFVRNRRDLVQTYESVEIDPDGSVVCGQRFQGLLSYPLDLKSFPLDRQILPIQITSFVYSPDEIQWAFDEQGTSKADKLSVLNWSVESMDTSVSIYRVAQVENGFVSCNFDMHARRFPAYYLTKVVVPLMLISFTSYLVFWLKTDQVIPQVSISVTAILGLITYWFTFQQNLPRIPYLTALDKYLISLMLLVFATLVQTVVTVNLADAGLDTVAVTTDQWMRWIFPALFLLLTALAFQMGFRRSREEPEV